MHRHRELSVLVGARVLPPWVGVDAVDRRAAMGPVARRDLVRLVTIHVHGLRCIVKLIFVKLVNRVVIVRFQR